MVLLDEMWYNHAMEFLCRNGGRMKKRKTLQDLTIKDNFMFGAVMQVEENCRGFLEMVLGFPIERVVISTEKSIIFCACTLKCVTIKSLTKRIKITQKNYKGIWNRLVLYSLFQRFHNNLTMIIPTSLSKRPLLTHLHFYIIMSMLLILCRNGGRMKKRKTLQDLTIKDNFMFGAVMQVEENCRGFLEMVLGFPIERVVISTEKSIIFCACTLKCVTIKSLTKRIKITQKNYKGEKSGGDSGGIS